METVTDFIFLGSKITADGDCSHEIKTFACWKKNYDQPRQHIKKLRQSLPTKVRLVKAMVFPVIMYGCESWTFRKLKTQETCVSCIASEFFTAEPPGKHSYAISL